MVTELTITSNLAEVQRFLELIEQSLHASDFTQSDIFASKLAVEEALVNAIKHGNQMDPDKHVHIIYEVTSERFTICIADEGAGFDPREKLDPNVHILERPCGRGLLLMRGFMTEVEFYGRGNTVRMVKVRETTIS